MEGKISDPIIGLYAGAMGHASDTFERFALEWLQGLIPFETGLWVEEVPTEPPELEVSAYPAHPAWVDPAWDVRRNLGTLSAAARANPGNALQGSTELRAAGLHPLWAESPFRHPAHLLGLAISDPELTLSRSVWLMRPQGETVFSPAEQLHLEALAPHLIRAQRIAALCATLLRLPAGGQKQGLALSDGRGIIRHANDVFLNHAREGFLDRNPPALPSALNPPAGRMWLAVRRRNIAFTGQSRPSGAMDVRSYQCCERMDRLTETEFQVAAHLFAGAGYKELARVLGLSPSTVTKHVNNCRAGAQRPGRCRGPADGVRAGRTYGCGRPGHRRGAARP